MTRKLLKEIERGLKNARPKQWIITYYMYNTYTRFVEEIDLKVLCYKIYYGNMCDEGYIIKLRKAENQRRASSYFV